MAINLKFPEYWRYILPVIFVGGLFLLHLILPWLAIHNALSLFIPAVLISAWYGGFGPGLLAIALSMFGAEYLFTPGFSFFVASTFDQTRIIVFICVSLAINLIIARLRRAKELAEEKEHQLEISETYLRDEISEREQLESSLKIALAKAEHANQAKSDFLANMSHELRTPMNAVVGIAHLLGMDGFSTEKRCELIKTLQFSAESLMELINNLLDISKIENARIELEHNPFDLKELAGKVLAIMAVKAQEKGVSLTLWYDDKLSAHFVGDSNRIRQILMNLISNAVKFTRQGNVTVRIYPCTNDSTGTREACVEVSDTGIGIPQNKLDCIFEKFSQADMSIARKYGGTGLGLPITKKLVELMWGRISVESRLGKGSVFKVMLPMLKAAPRSREALEQQKPAQDKQKPLVLLVEDYAPNVLVETSILGQLGYPYEVAQNGQEAVMKISQNHFDVVLMDVQMPVMDGYAAACAIRRREQELGLPHIPIIGITAYALSEDRKKCLKAGMDDYISKPFNPYDLENKMALLTQEKH